MSTNKMASRGKKVSPPAPPAQRAVKEEEDSGSENEYESGSENDNVDDDDNEQVDEAGDSGDSDSEDESEAEADEEDNETETKQPGKDGFADMMSRILNQTAKAGDKSDEHIPVLSKRKTAMMKEIEDESTEKARAKKLKLEKKANKEKHLVVPDVSTADFERELKRLATRGGNS
jgi:TATA-binding protein-associated factor Taf7